MMAMLFALVFVTELIAWIGKSVLQEFVRAETFVLMTFLMDIRCRCDLLSGRYTRFTCAFSIALP